MDRLEAHHKWFSALYNFGCNFLWYDLWKVFLRNLVMDNLKEKISELIWKELNDEAFFLPTEKLNKASDKILSLILNQITKEVEGIMPAKRAKELADNL